MDNTSKIDRILNDAKKKIRPDIKVVKDADNLVKDINVLLKKHGITAECVKGGSIAKETFLKNDYDIDLFVRFNPSYKNQNISEILEKILRELCDKLKVGLERIHGSRDYFQFHIIRDKKIIIIEIIPVILIHTENYTDAENITDLSPEHVTWVKKYTSKKPELVDDIRLAKQFCKANKVYGAESYINGFSGHILDILIIHYGSFLNLLKTFSKYDIKVLDQPIIIDTEKNLSNPIKQLNKSKITPLIIVDPIQKDRNSAAALSKEKLLMFIISAKAFLSKPDKKFFDIKEFNIDEEISRSLKELKLKKKDVHIAKIDIDTLDGSKDVVGTKVLKAYEMILNQLRLNDFKILKSDWNFIFNERRAEAYIIIDKKITREFVQEGPPISAKDDNKKFLDKHKALDHEIRFKDGRAYVMIPRRFLDPKAFITDIVKKDFISRRIKGLFVR
jgi:tRNA nucleotidyltransferase (CCA-adding enzyme)